MESGPLAAWEKAEIRAFAPKWRELVVHFGKWTTGYPEKVGKPGIFPEIVRASGPLWRVGH